MQKMDKYEAVKLIGEKIYTYSINRQKTKDFIEAYLWSDKIDYVGENELYIIGNNISDDYIRHPYKEYKQTWFLNKQECVDYLFEIADIITDETDEE